ncbi:MAG TPA: hypothetical protein VGD17_19095 [Chitinophagaceae bacterium]
MSENLQYRLYNASIDPPDTAWPNIIEQLDTEAAQKLSLKLQQATIDPPAGVWENISEVLDGTGSSKVIPITRRWNRVAVAAIAAGIIVLAGLFYFLTSDAGNRQTAADEKKEVVPPANNDRVINNNNRDVVRNTQADQPEEADTITATPIQVASLNRRPMTTRVRYARVENETGENADNTLHVDEVIDQPVSTDPGTYVGPQDYLTIAAPNGQPAKISVKFTDAMSFLLTDEPAMSMDMALKSISWKRRISNWSNKLLSGSAFMPAATNFFDIVELEELLKEQ